MLKGSKIIAFTFFLTLLFVVISTNVAYSQQTAERGVSINNESEVILKKRCPIITPWGTIPCSHRGPAPEILNTRPELNGVTSAVAIEKLEALKASGQATGDDYLLLGYFYSLERKYDLSEANYLKALQLATDTERKAIAEQGLKDVRAATAMQ